METLYTLSLLLIGVIATNIIKDFIPKIPEAFILIIVGVAMSFTPIFNNFELEPEFFMLMIIAPIMFIDGQKQSFSKIKKRFGGIWTLSVVLAVVTALVVGMITNHVEVAWTLPLAITLAAIVTPTDAVAVKSLTAGTDMPEGVGEALELESLFNDATGLVMLDLSLSVLSKGTFSVLNGLEHFFFVAFGGVVIGTISGLLIVALRVNLQQRASNPETTIIPISLLTPFAVYLLAEHLGTSGILAVVATGMVHNWESSRLRLTSTSVQLTSRTIWGTIADVLNDIVFLILGISLPTVWSAMTKIGVSGTLQLAALSLLIYVVMLVLRYFWALRDDDRNNRSRRHRQTLPSFFGDRNDQNHRFYAQIFAISGVHGTVTLAMAFSLPYQIGGRAFPYREELIIVATIVILLSMLISAIVLPLSLPKKVEAYSDSDLIHIRDKMVDYASLKILDTVTDHSTREVLSAQLQSQKNKLFMMDDRKRQSSEFIDLIADTQDFMIAYVHGDYASATYSLTTINAYTKILTYSFNNGQKPMGHFSHHLKHTLKRFMRQSAWHLANGAITKAQRDRIRKTKLASDPKFAESVEKWTNTRKEMLRLNEDVITATDKHLDDLLRERLDNKRSDNDYIYMTRETMNRFFSAIKRDYRQQTTQVDNSLYIQAFQFEYDFVQQGVTDGFIPTSMASVLYTEINQAQTLQLQENNQFDAIGG
ncbi:sodium:proton antiporter [Leuconostoc pseudomesenteroides]|jgi:monovalent cation/hydrogen antiporter|uniref:cation:proton antiporter n=1 Tax=Leuconostoc pseudomesenteroides TaxID=33968 RepID=UPI0011DD91D3|nr:sodium:proton antiporter [Leuconostoc pseudomesenteroides]MBS0957344.1 sodium:proton antiporter [Leuconostoc pseudomesenteroides]MCT4380991.1 sodium:proton antiporter [Leuconostoc pseudomesenteroides]MCT4412160.1 sodium:proton antiporter [Leuconostoc pseudomesenteroides]